jgi:hypothetical protein
MKKFKGFLLFFLTSISFLLSSDLEGQSVWECGYDSAHAEALLLSPDYQQSQIDFNELWRSQMTPSSNNFNGGGTPFPRITIPVVVHVVYNSNDAIIPSLNITADQIESQIAKLNEAFSNISGTDSEIRFCLASAPSTFFTNPSEPGIIRYPISPPQTPLYNFPGGNSAGFALRSLFPVGFIAENYLNIFIVYNFANPAVYMARAILELEVNDFLLGLRTMQPQSSAGIICEDLLKFYNLYIAIPDKTSPIQLEYFDKVGRLIFQEKTTEDLGAEKIKLLKSKAVFLIRARQGNCIKVYKLP